MTEPCDKERDIASLIEFNNGMIRWQKAQNGSIMKIESKVDRLLWIALAAAIGAFINIFV